MEQENNNEIFLKEVKIQIENFKRYRNYFIGQKDYLLTNVKGRYIAIEERGLLDADINRRNLQRKIYEKYGSIQIFIDKVEEGRFQKELPEIFLEDEFEVLAVKREDE